MSSLQRGHAGPVVAFYVSGHGFGHASRDIEVINAALALHPQLRVEVRTSAPRWLFDLTARGPVRVSQSASDTGVAQVSSLEPDIPATVATAARFYADLDRKADVEARWLEETQTSLVLSDMPPLAFEAAARARVPSVALGNFTWDWIYDGYARWLGDAGWLPERIRAMHALADEAWRLPMYGGFDGFARVVDLPFVARHSSRSRGDTRSALEAQSDRPIVLVSFGGFGLEGLPLEQVARRGGCMLVTTALPSNLGRRDARLVSYPVERLCVVDEHAWYECGRRYEDLVAAADLVVTKPGYGIVSECIANGPAVLFTPRGEFAEYDVLRREMPRYLRCHEIGHSDLLGGRWEPHIEALLAQQPPPEVAETDGARVAARRLADRLGLPSGPTASRDCRAE